MSKPHLIQSYTSPQKGFVESDSSSTRNYDQLSTQIVDQLKDKNFDTIIFDFDGTLTKHHSQREENRSKLGLSNHWFADIVILKQILEKGNEAGITFYITSKQDKKTIEDILENNELKNYFRDIFGKEIPKELAISQIALREDNKNILYFDDNLETTSSPKIASIKGLLPYLHHKVC